MKTIETAPLGTKMTLESALTFLRNHQPLPKDASDALLKQLDDARRYFICVLDARCIPLLTGALDEGGGHGLYQTIEDTLQAYPHETVVDALITRMGGSRVGRYWAVEIAASFPDDQLVVPLLSVFHTGSEDERMAALAALAAIGTPSALNGLKSLEALEVEQSVQDLLGEILGKD